jgi:hypothetical protein
MQRQTLWKCPKCGSESRPPHSTKATTGYLLVPRPRLLDPAPLGGLPPTYVSSTSTVPPSWSASAGAHGVPDAVQ